jgi:hypothetical protein
MMYEDVIADFAKRTEANLRAIRQLARQGGATPAFEVTQLVNSMLGLLVFPQQRYLERIPETPIADLASRGWPIPDMMGDYPQVPHLRQLVRMLRDAITHCNLKFEPGVSDEIEALTVWNTEPRSGKVTWKARLTVADLDAITTRFVALLLDRKTFG